MSKCKWTKRVLFWFVFLEEWGSNNGEATHHQQEKKNSVEKRNLQSLHTFNLVLAIDKDLVTPVNYGYTTLLCTQGIILKMYQVTALCYIHSTY